MIARILACIAAFLSRFFARRSPIGFDKETGSWIEPDIILQQDGAMSRPLVNRDCNRSHVVYAAHIDIVEQCTFREQAAALAAAIDKARTYFDQQFRCENPDCIQKVGDILWTGVSCHSDPVTATGAVLVRFRCTIEL